MEPVLLKYFTGVVGCVDGSLRLAEDSCVCVWMYVSIRTEPHRESFPRRDGQS